MADISSESLNTNNVRQLLGTVSTSSGEETRISEAQREGNSLQCLAIALDRLSAEAGLVRVAGGAGGAEGVYSARLSLAGAPRRTCTLTALKLGAVALVNATLEDPVETYGACFPLSSFAPSDDPSSVMRKVSRVFSERIACPARSGLLMRSGVASASLGGLPRELQGRVLGLAGRRAALAAGATSRGLRAAALDEALWRRFLLADFGRGARDACRGYGLSWYDNYKFLHVCSREDSKFAVFASPLLDRKFAKFERIYAVQKNPET